MKIKIKVKPNSKTGEVISHNDEFTVRVKSSPHDGKANTELIALLADYFNMPKSRVSIISGFKSKIKTILLHE